MNQVAHHMVESTEMDIAESDVVEEIKSALQIKLDALVETNVLPKGVVVDSVALESEPINNSRSGFRESMWIAYLKDSQAGFIQIQVYATLWEEEGGKLEIKGEIYPDLRRLGVSPV